MSYTKRGLYIIKFVDGEILLVKLHWAGGTNPTRILKQNTHMLPCMFPDRLEAF